MFPVMIEPKVLFVGPIDSSKLKVDVVESNRRTNPQIDQMVEEKWKELKSWADREGRTLFNGTSYRLNTVTEVDDAVKLEVAEIKYNIRRSLAGLSDILSEYGEDFYGKGMAIGGPVRTLDGKYVFGLRSGKSVTPTDIDFIGGILEDFEFKDGSSLLEKDKSELCEELGIGDLDIRSIEILGLVLSNTGNVIVITFTDLAVNSNQLSQLFSNADEEMKKIIFVEENALKNYLNNLGGYKPSVVELLQKIRRL